MEVHTEQDAERFDPAEWVNRHGDLLYRYAYARLRNSESAEEVVQETFVSGLRYASQYAGKGSEGAWLLGILKRKIIDFVRQAARAGSQVDSQEKVDFSEVLYDQKGAWRKEFRRDDYRPLDSLEREEFWQVLRECMKGLPKRQADVFSLRTLEQLDTDTIGKELEITSSTVWVMLHRARIRLANCMRSRWQEG